jgi:drug/metabolite transporter (DMT)-like permease
MKPRDLIALFSLAALWGASFLFIRVAAPAFGAFPLATGRVLIAAVVLYAVIRATGMRTSLREHAGKLLVLGALNASIPFVLVAGAELHLSASMAAMLNATVPLWATLFGAVWLGERFTTKRSVGLVLGGIGVAGLVGWSPVTFTTPVIASIVAMLVASASYALAGIYIRKRMTSVSKPTLVLGQQLGAAAWLLLPAVLQAPGQQVSGRAASSLLALALLCTALAYPLYFHLIRSVGPTRTTTVTYLIPLFGTAWGAIFLHEPVTRGMLVGLTLILASVLLVNDVRFGSLFVRRATSPHSAVL